MIYSNSLVSKVRKLFPDSPVMIQLAYEGKEILGRYLDDSCSGGFSVDTILNATSLEELQHRARELKEKQTLYRQWLEEAEEFRKKHSK